MIDLKGIGCLLWSGAVFLVLAAVIAVTLAIGILILGIKALF